MIGSKVEVEELRVDKSMARSSLITVEKTKYIDVNAGKWVRCDGGMSGRYFFLLQLFQWNGNKIIIEN